MPRGVLRVFLDADEVAAFAAERILAQAHQAVRLRDRFSLVLSGGNTPRKLLELLGRRPYRDLLPWQHMHILWADERMVPYESDESNYGEAWRLLFSQGMAPEENLHPIEVGVPIERSLLQYQEVIKGFARKGEKWPRFDLVLLGMGPDGHTASLFPGEISSSERSQPVIAVQAPPNAYHAMRVSMTPVILNRSKQIMFMAHGREKAPALAAVLQGKFDPEHLPAQRIQLRTGRLIWLVDQAAASALDR